MWEKDDVGGWVERYRERRSFATTVPLLTFEVNGSGEGEEIRFSPGTTYRATLRVDVISRMPVGRVKSIQNGRVIASADARGARTFRLERQVQFDGSSWFATRVYGPGAPGLTADARAHSSPVYVSAGGKSALVREDLMVALRWVDRLWAYLVERDNFGSRENREAVAEMIEDARRHYREKLQSL